MYLCNTNDKTFQRTHHKNTYKVSYLLETFITLTISSKVQQTNDSKEVFNIRKARFALSSGIRENHQRLDGVADRWQCDRAFF